jgi:thiamine-phosphate pyrophosphorylase
MKNNPKAHKPTLPHGIYGMTAEKFSKGRGNIQVVEAMIEGGVQIIQYREKRPAKSFRDMLTECRRIRELTRRAGVLFIVNDFVELALMAEADGVHLGQDDWPITEVRRLVGPEMMIGLSTHSPQQARKAVDLGADYIGVGPIYATQTKDDVCAPVGLDYLDYAHAHVTIPFVAIGGIKSHNIAQVVEHGAKTVCLVTEIVAAGDIPATVSHLVSIQKKHLS